MGNQGFPVSSSRAEAVVEWYLLGGRKNKTNKSSDEAKNYHLAMRWSLSYITLHHKEKFITHLEQLAWMKRILQDFVVQNLLIVTVRKEEENGEKVMTFGALLCYSGNLGESSCGLQEAKLAANIFLEDGRSLLDCQKEVLCNNKSASGELIICDSCPSTYHKSCLGLKDVPTGEWFYTSCCEKTMENFVDDKVFHTCYQCEHKFHKSCPRSRGEVKYNEVLEDNRRMLNEAIDVTHECFEPAMDRFKYCEQGMCRRLMGELERQLVETGVMKLILPSAPSVLNTWITKFKFSKKTEYERLKYSNHIFLDFRDTIMCLKQLMKTELKTKK
ncbi:hypothetical protein Pint_36089 [Pistacia integerrima]|uniref:Uncharacterized protein n=1 Tax=Pistacia integerrima TaxID=434235 RepID=A0ACC0Y4B4_9ROSI|nr:hypothetical protein Pint_36089 [Pistacia integerrima]